MCTDTKTCTRCKVEKPVSEFSKDNGRPVPSCKLCRREIWAERYQGRREAKKIREDNWKFTLLMASWPAPPKGAHQ